VTNRNGHNLETGSPRPLAAVVHASLPPESWKDLLPGHPRLACFLTNPAAFHRLVKSLDMQAEFLDTGEAVNRWMGTIRSSLVNLDIAFDGTENDPLWQASDLAERNPSICGLNHLACVWLAGVEALSSVRGPVILVVEHSGLGLVLLREARKLGYRAVWRHPNRMVQAWPSLAEPWRWSRLLWAGVRNRWNHLLDFTKRKAALARIGPRLPVPGKRDRLVALWADASTFPPKEHLREDAYYGCLPGLFRDKGERTLYLALSLCWVDPFDAIVRTAAATAEETILPEQCLGIGQALSACLRTLFWRPRMARRLLLDGRDATWLLRDALHEVRAGIRQTEALHFLHVGRYLERLGVRPDALMHLYENQPWEKTLRMGIKRAFPGISCTGYMHAPFSRNYIGFLPSRKDVEAGNIPDLLVTPGRAWLDIMLREGMPAGKLAEGPSLRHGHYHAACQAQHAAVNASPGGTSARRESLAVLLAGPMDMRKFEADIGFVLAGAMSSLPRLRALLKPHPKAASLELASVQKRPLPGGACLTGKPAPELLPIVDAVLHSGSTLALEALCLGKNPIFLGSPAGLDMDKLDWFPGVSQTVRTPAELTDALRALSLETASQAQARRERGKDVLKQLFNPASSALLDIFFQH
jgi:hypothetical protein